MICHGVPDIRELEDGDTVNVDVTVVVDGYHGDLSETYCVGKVDSKHVVSFRSSSHIVYIYMCVCVYALTRHSNCVGCQHDRQNRASCLFLSQLEGPWDVPN